MINDDCNTFCLEWNAHPILGQGGGQSPNVHINFSSYSKHQVSSILKELAYLGALEHGVYADECENLMEEEIYNYYSILFTARRSQHDSEDSDSDRENEIIEDNNETESELEIEETYLGFDPVEVWKVPLITFQF